MLNKRKFVLIFILYILGTLYSCTKQNIRENNRILLEGSWNFKIDKMDVGLQEKWFTQNFKDTIQLPGSLQENGYGNEVTIHTEWTGQIVDRSWFTEDKYAEYRKPGNIKIPFWLQPKKHYIGAAWYQKQVTIPETWQDKQIFMFLERCHWKTQLWVDENLIGTQKSLSAPHEYDLTKYLTPGLHRLTLRIDNRFIVDVGQNAHSVSDHTQTNWNGVIGKIYLQALDRIFIETIRTFPEIKTNRVKVEILIKNTSNSILQGKLKISGSSKTDSKKNKIKSLQFESDINSGINLITAQYSLGEKVWLWDEFHPVLYRLSVNIKGDSFVDEKSVSFGMREFTTRGTYFIINGRPTFLRGTLECCIFPRTGYPSMDTAEWLRIFQVCRDHGLNHMRFHSWCPPEAAFDAADQMGFYLQVECGAWTEVGSGKPFDEWLYDESERMVKAYGNHPSFCMLAYGNEPSGDNQESFLGDFVRFWQNKDPRHVYTSAAGWPLIEESDYHSTYEPRIQLWGAGLSSIINSLPPQTRFDFKEIIEKYNRPVVSHEIGQWCVYPNFKEIPKYNGFLIPRNFEIFRETLQKNHLGSLADSFLQSSGKLQALCYKADIEAALRTEGMAGFQLLDLHDFPGQGTALVGIVDAFWDQKGYIEPQEFMRFSSPTVPLARMDRRTFTTNQTFSADIEVAHFGETIMTNVMPLWSIQDSNGQIYAEGKLSTRNIPIGNNIPLGRVQWNLKSASAPSRYDLVVRINQHENSWPFWVYPENLDLNEETNILIASSMEEDTINHLNSGGSVLLTIPQRRLHPDKGGRIGLGFSPIFWNTAWTKKQKPHTLGILCDPKHPALTEFPTEFHSNWQWWEILHQAKVIILDDLPYSLDPVIRVIDDWFENRRLGLVFEANIGEGKILVSGIDFSQDLSLDPSLRQLYYSLKKYLVSPNFKPAVNLSIGDIQALFKAPSLLDSARVTEYDSQMPGFEAELIIDDDPATFWHTPWGEDECEYPHSVVIDLGERKTFTGFELIPRQDGNLNGLISIVYLYLSNDGEWWGGPVITAKFPMTSDPQILRLPRRRSARFIKLEAIEGFSEQKFASLAELRIF